MFSKLAVLAIPLSAVLLTACGSMHHKDHKEAATSTPVRSADGVLVGPDGRTLYTFTKDTAGSGASTCYQQCATNWPPLGVAPGAKPIGDFSIITRTDNTQQWAYKGWPLYYFAKDSQAGDKRGDGMGGGVWKLATP
ncbi:MULTISPECIES: ATP-binding protein [Comamonas]|jgi:predicted lipoprotein with Yx(FWY)xxD motif|uniref:ATP-binding protein n=1 Tax=Comamonas sediminis TaxID=1783360 RepID=A0ABV4B1W3_9BURK|nr:MULTISPECIES: ATP-binding protein [unclassified Comamonas]ULR90516.1 ATP-binding protein [Comamonas sp. B21-038]